jgi:hypothetical protein
MWSTARCSQRGKSAQILSRSSGVAPVFRTCLEQVPDAQAELFDTVEHRRPLVRRNLARSTRSALRAPSHTNMPRPRRFPPGPRQPAPAGLGNRDRVELEPRGDVAPRRGLALGQRSVEDHRDGAFPVASRSAGCRSSCRHRQWSCGGLSRRRSVAEQEQVDRTRVWVAAFADRACGLDCAGTRRKVGGRASSAPACWRRRREWPVKANVRNQEQGAECRPSDGYASIAAWSQLQHGFVSRFGRLPVQCCSEL